MKKLRIAAITPNKKQDYLTESILIGLQELGHDVKTSDIGNSIDSCLTENDFLEFSSSADCILSFFGKIRGNPSPKYHLLNMINRWDITAYVDGSEWTATGNPNPNQTLLAKKDVRFRKGIPWINQAFYQKCKFYFKRECYPEDIAMGIIPLPFAAKQSSKCQEKTEKKFDIFCAFGQTNDGLRAEVENFLKEWKSSFSVKIEKNMNYSQFIKSLSESKIAIDAWGGGDCCARFWEIAINNVCLAYQKYNIIIPNPYTDMENCIEYSTINELEQKLTLLLNDNSLLETITKNCYDHTLKYHTTAERAKYMLEKMGFK